MTPTKHENIFKLYLSLDIASRFKVKNALARNIKVMDFKIESWITTKTTPAEHQDIFISTLQNITALNNNKL